MKKRKKTPWLARALAVSTVFGAASAAGAAELPQIKVADGNAVMACATPGRLMAYLKANNSNLADKFESLATEYMRTGEELGIRWDYAFFQMLVETGYLKFTGDVSVEQNNFAGLGATGKGAKGETFPDVATGARAHLQHILMYTGETVDNPVAQRTRDVQAWGVLTKWQQTIKRPMTFKDLASKWAPTSKAYPRDIANVADRFTKGICKQDDPAPELVAEARGGKADPEAQTAQSEDPEAKTGTKAAAPDTASEPAKAAKSPPAVAAASEAPAGEPAKSGEPAKKEPASGLKVINSQPSATPPADSAAATKAAPAASGSDKSADTSTTAPDKSADNKAAEPAKAAEKTFETASVAGDAAKAKIGSAANQKCKVWQASYGGSKAVIIKATAEKMTNYTVLDVNDGAEKREADAYIAAYAKGGATVAEFSNSTQALEKAFELCPEG